MTTKAVLAIRGLYTGDNQLASAPEGALSKADNVVIPYADSLEPRRGQRKETNTYGSGASNEVAFFGGGKVVHFSTASLARNSTLDGSYTAISGTYTPVDASLLRMKFVEMAQSLYFNTALGLYGMESLTSAPAAAGIPKGRENLFSVKQSVGSFMAADTAVAYAVVWGKKDVNGNVKLGPPSEVMVARNTNIVIPIAGITRSAPDGTHPAGTVTVALPTGHITVSVGDVLTLSPGEANFAAGAKTVISVTVGATAFTYDEAGANVSSASAETFGAARGVRIDAFLPTGVTDTSGHFARYYRSQTVAGATSQPGLDLFQIFEQVPSAADVIATHLEFDDTTPDAYLVSGSNPIYTSPNFGDGIGSANETPPIAKDIFEFDGRMWFCNTTDKHRFFLNLLGVYAASPDGGIQNLDTIHINSLSYQGKTGFVTVDGDFHIVTSGSVAQNIEDTARNLVRSINTHTSNTTLVAFYVSGADDVPGRILIEERAPGGSSFAVYASRSTSWFPALPTGSSGAPTSDNSRRLNGLSFSKRGQPEAVPLTNFVTAGPKNREAIRAVPLRDKIFVFIQNVGIWTVAKSGSGYRVDRLDTTAKLLAPDSLQEHSNQLIGLFDQGVCSVSDAGVRILSGPIESDLVSRVTLLLATAGVSAAANFKARIFAVSNEADRQYQLWLPATSVSTTCFRAYVYNSLRNGWTQWSATRSCGRVEPGGLLYLGDATTNFIRVERKGSNSLDYCDEELSVTVGAGPIVLASGVPLSSVSGVAVGDVLFQISSGTSGVITSIVGSSVFITGTTVPDASTAALVLKAYAVDAQFVARTGDPAVLKHFREVMFHFAGANFTRMATYFNSEIGTHTETTGLTMVKETWLSGSPPLPENVRAEVPIAHSRCARLQVGIRITEARAQWRLSGYSATYETISAQAVR